MNQVQQQVNLFGKFNKMKSLLLNKRNLIES